jgi:hypothetical protein
MGYPKFEFRLIGSFWYIRGVFGLETAEEVREEHSLLD